MRWPASVRETRGSHPAVQAVRSRACPHKGAAPGARNTGAVPPRCWRAGVSGLPPERPGSGGRTEQASNTARGAPRVRRTCGRHDRIAALTSGDHAPASRDSGARGSETDPGVPRALEPGADARLATRAQGAGMRTAARTDALSDNSMLKRRCLKIESGSRTERRQVVDARVKPAHEGKRRSSLIGMAGHRRAMQRRAQNRGPAMTEETASEGRLDSVWRSHRPAP